MDAVKTALRTRIKELVGSEEVIFADQNSPRPSLPYWSIRLQTQSRVGRDAYSQGVTAQGDITVSGQREVVARIQRYGAGSVSAVADLRDNLAKISVIEKFSTSKLCVYEIGEVQNLPYPLDNAQLEERGILDLFIRFGTKLLDNVGIVETVGIAAGFDGKPDLAETITVVL